MTAVENVIIRTLVQGGEKAVAQVDALRKKLAGFAKGMKNFTKVLFQPIDVWKENVSGGRQFITMGGRVASSLRNMLHGLRGFRMEALGVMFFGKMIQMTITNLFKPIMEVFGVTQLFQEMLTLLLLPVMEDLFPFFLSLFEFFTNLSEPTKKATGVFLLLVGAFGTLLFISGSLVLGLGSLILFISTIVVAFTVFAGIIGISVSALLGIVLVVPLIIVALIAIVVLFVKNKEKIALIFLKLEIFMRNWWIKFKVNAKAGAKAVVEAVLSDFRRLGISFSLIWQNLFATMNNAIPGWIKDLLGVPNFHMTVTPLTGTFAGFEQRRSLDSILKSQAPFTNVTPEAFRERNPDLFTINQVNNITTGVTKSELDRALREHDKKLVDDVRRLVKP